MFSIWYNHFTEDSTRNDSDNLNDLFKTYQLAGIDVYKASEQSRKDIIAEHMYDYLNDVLANDPAVSEITLPDVLKHLNSRLDVRLIDLNNLFKDVSSKLATTYDIVRLPFKIQRHK